MHESNSHTDSEHDGDELPAVARQALNGRAAALDAAALSRLNRARRSAVQAIDRPHLAAPGRRLAYWTGGAITATAAVLLAVLWQTSHVPGGLPGDELAGPEWLSDIELIELEDDLELVEEPEFYDWLARQAEKPGSA